MIETSRRKFLKLLFFGAGIAIASLLGFIFVKPSILDWRPRFYLKRRNPKLGRQPVGKLDPKQLSSLTSAAEVIVDNQISKLHFEDYFEWRAENLPGYYDLYSRFCARLDEWAQNKYQLTFAECPKQSRKKILKGIPEPKTIRRLILNLKGEEEYTLFYSYIIIEILTLYRHSDAWSLLGYKYWPGQARGFDEYKKPPKK